jgi:hypothetical protein
VTYDNTLLGRCVVAHEEAVQAIDYPPHTMRARRTGVAAVLEHLAAELLVMNQRNERLSVHEVARILTLEAASQLAGWDQEAEEPDV